MEAKEIACFERFPRDRFENIFYNGERQKAFSLAGLESDAKRDTVKFMGISLYG